MKKSRYSPAGPGEEVPLPDDAAPTGNRRYPRYVMRFRRQSEAERRRAEAMAGRPNFHFHFTRELAAAALWDYGEDQLWERVLAVSDADLLLIQNIASVYEDPAYPLPMDGRITHHHVTALAAVTFFQELRPLARTRRRPEKQRPAALHVDKLQAALLASLGGSAGAG